MLSILMGRIERQLGPHTDSRTVTDARYTMTILTFGEVEVVTCLDNKRLKVGQKRNFLMGKCSGDYFAFVDDDDVISDDYFAQILPRCNGLYDLIVFKAIMFYNARPHCNVEYDPKHTRDFDGPARGAKTITTKDGRTIALNGQRTESLGWAYRVPNHLMVWKRSVAAHVPFPNISLGEDGQWAQKMKGRAKNVHRIDSVLYHYMYSPETTETQKRRR